MVNGMKTSRKTQSAEIAGDDKFAIEAVGFLKHNILGTVEGYIAGLEEQSAKEEAEIMDGKEYAKSLKCNDDEKLEQASEAQREAEELGIFPGTTVLDENGSYTVISIFTDSRGACALLSDDGDGRTIMAVPFRQFDELGLTVA